MRAELARMMEAHRRTLDQLATAVAIFGADQRLALLQRRLPRALGPRRRPFSIQGRPIPPCSTGCAPARKLPEQADFRNWKNELHEAYRALEAREHEWHLPDGRTLRVVTTPNPEGGVTYLFDDVTERLDLERRYDALIRVQGETLDTSPRRRGVRQRRAAAAAQSGLRADVEAQARGAHRAERPHIEAVHRLVPAAARRRRVLDAAARRRHRARSASRSRRGSSARDGSVVDCATVPLPDGATLVTFQDVTDTVNVERALRERNEALEAADRLKIDFVHHVSYELRSPLTNIIGFAHLLLDPAIGPTIGPLTDKQREYLGYITGLVQRAARHHQRHPRSRHDRRRRDDARPRAVDIREAVDAAAGACRTACREGDPARHPRRARHRQLRGRRAARAAGAVQPACPTRSASRRRARSCASPPSG